MLGYIIRRILYFIPILLGVVIVTFVLFFMINSPDDIARFHLGGRYESQEAIDDWKYAHGYHLPLFINHQAENFNKFTETIFWTKSINLIIFNFGVSDGGRDISQALQERMLPSLVLAVPALLLGVWINISFAILLALFKGEWIDTWGVLVCVVLMSISYLFYIVGAQYLIAKIFRWVPISGFQDGWLAVKFLLLPVFVSVIGGVGSGVRWYRSFFIEELSKEYVLTARARGVSELTILFKHVLKNALIPILTGIVVVIPLLFMGSLLTESFFGIPGLGSYTIDAIYHQDFAIVRTMVYIGSLLYMLGLLLTDLSYVIVDPRVRLNS